ncbi:lipase family protein [Nocardia macrotermitis]|uniref:Putative inactive lipase n=1 Tax=Nocardia macrotermitis TaxID=2585198 RepID=A0A7K0D262_9NOCA|nr:lipase family protein [Nocardia macrotermitis]MQY19731.1 putative inactive lipase [Nocardia macrotermitis]
MRGFRPLRPDQDPFYRPPAGFEHRAPGELLRSRVVELAVFGVVPLRVSAWQLLYRTSDLNGVPEASVTTVLLPRGAVPDGRRPLISFQCAIDALAPQCFPSYALRRGARALGAIPQLEVPLIAAALARGWAVSVPDHGGPGGRFGAPREPGYRALDGIRAALAFGSLGLDADTPVALWGYSGGGLATVWAAEVAARYAPELAIVGAVAGSPVGDPGSAFVRLNGTLFAGFAMVFLAGLRRTYPTLEPIAQLRVRPRYLDMLAKAEVGVTLPLLARLARRDVGRYSDLDVDTLLGLPEMRRIITDIRPGVVAPTMPLLIVQGVNDEIIAVADIDALVERYVGAGARVEYLRDRFSTHFLLQFIAIPTMLDWIADRLADIPAPSGTRTVRSVAASRRASRGHRTMARLSARLLTGRPIRSEPLVPQVDRAGQHPDATRLTGS